MISELYRLIDVKLVDNAFECECIEEYFSYFVPDSASEIPKRGIFNTFNVNWHKNCSSITLNEMLAENVN